MFRVFQEHTRWYLGTLCAVFKGQTAISLSFVESMSHCCENSLQCVKLAVLVWASDGEANNRKATKTIKEAKGIQNY